MTARRRSLEPLWRFGRAHARRLAQGLAATIGIVFVRLAIPWPLRGVVEFAFPAGKHAGDALHRYLPSWGEPLIWFCGAYLLLAVASGLFETLQRIAMGQFVSRTVRDLRSAAFKAGAQRHRGVGSAAGELIARLVADAARLRGYLSGILVHVSKDALLFFAVVLLFVLWISPTMGAFFLLGGLLACLVGYWASRPLESAARRARHHDGAWAATIQQALEQGDLVGAADGSSVEADEGSDGDAHSRRILGAASVAAHALLGLNVCLAIWTGVSEVRAGSLAPGELFLFIAYALIIHRRLVDAGRQVARIGKLRATVERLAALLGDASDVSVPALPLNEGVRVEALHVEAVRGSRPRLDEVALEVAARSRVAIVGRPGDGKSTLLRCLAGLEPAAAGRMYWDGVELGPFDASVCASVGYLPQHPVFPRAPVWQHLGLPGPDALAAGDAELLRRIGTFDVIERLPKGIRQKVGSATLSREEARLLALGAVLLSAAPLIALDSPCEGLSKRNAAERLDAVFDAVEGRTLLVALPRSSEASAFARVIVLRKGRIAFDGAFDERMALKAARLEEEAPACRA